MEPRVRILTLLHLVNKTLVHLPQTLLVNASVGSADRYKEGGYFCENHFFLLLYGADAHLCGRLYEILDGIALGANNRKQSTPWLAISIKLNLCKIEISI
jgi:hypothetical protein